MFSGHVCAQCTASSYLTMKILFYTGEMTHIKGDFHSHGGAMSTIGDKNVNCYSCKILIRKSQRKHWRGSAYQQGQGRFMTFRGFAHHITAGVLSPSLKGMATLAPCCQSNCSVDRNVSDNCRRNRFPFRMSENGSLVSSSHICQRLN